MNKTYRSIWNESTGTWVAVQENATACGKKSRSARLIVAEAFGATAAAAQMGAETDKGLSWDSGRAAKSIAFAIAALGAAAQAHAYQAGTGANAVVSNLDTAVGDGAYGVGG